eukprot:4900614-Pleurochrysis_carterae.AAC.1
MCCPVLLIHGRDGSGTSKQHVGMYWEEGTGWLIQHTQDSHGPLLRHGMRRHERGYKRIHITARSKRPRSALMQA